MNNLWQETARETAAYAPLDAEAQADLVIIGGGFTGCSAALHAAGQGASVRLVEAETIGYGGSGRNVGLVNAGLWTPPEKIVASLGREAGDRLNSLLGGAPELVFSLIEEHAISCEARRAGTLHCAHSRSGLADLRDRYRQLRALDAPVTLLSAGETRERTGSKIYYGALHDARAGTIQPLAYCRGLARAASKAGAVLHEQSQALSIAREGSQWIVTTPGGTIRAQALLLATNAYHQGATGLPAPQSVPVAYFQMATRPLGDNLRGAVLPGGEGCWDTARVMSSFRMDDAGRLIIGGCGSLDHGGGEVHRAWAARKLAALFPDLRNEPLEYSWFGNIAMTSDHLPRILRLGERAFAIFGYSGRGIGPGTVFGKHAASACLGANYDALPIPPIDAHSEPLARARSGFYELGIALTHLVSDRTPIERLH